MEGVVPIQDEFESNLRQSCAQATAQHPQCCPRRLEGIPGAM